MVNDPRHTTDLIASVRARADMTGSTVVTDAEICEYLSAAAAKLTDLLITVLGEDHFVTHYDATVLAGAGVFDFTADIAHMPWRIVRVDRVIQQARVPLERFNLSDTTLDNVARDWTLCPVRYSWRGAKLHFDPVNLAAATVRVYYVPMPPVFDAAAVPSPDLPIQLIRWDRYLIIAAAIECRDKQESDVTVLTGELARIVADIQALGGPKDIGQAPVQVKTRFLDDYSERRRELWDFDPYY